MSRLTIHLATDDARDDDRDVLDINVTHLVTREVVAGDLQEPRMKSPGLIILLPRNGTFSLATDDTPMLLAPGLAYILGGASERRIVTTASQDADEENEPRVQMIECNAVINQMALLPELVRTPIQLDPATSEEVERLYKRLAQGPGEGSLLAGREDIMRHMFAARLVVLMLGNAGSESAESYKDGNNDPIMRMKAYMMRYMSSNPSTEEIARHLGMSRSSFYRWATPLLGETPIQYLRKLRLERCQELLRNSALSIEEIAERTGYSSRHHLTNEFTRQYDISPAKLRNLAQSATVSDPAAEIEELIQARQFEQALDMCTKTLRSRQTAVGDRVRHQQALCLLALGRSDEAAELWEALSDGAWAYQASKQLCSLYFRRGERQRAIGVLARIFPVADAAQQRELILVWNHQILELISNHEVAHILPYLEFRIEFFPGDLRTMSITTEALIGIGQEQLVPDHCPRLTSRCFFCLRRSGLFDRAIAEYGDQMDSHFIQKTHIQAGRYAEAMTMDTGRSGYMVEALMGLGRAEEAIERYPDHCQQALFALERYDDILVRGGDPSELHVYALHRLGRTDELRNFPRHDHWLWEVAQLHVGPEHALNLSPPLPVDLQNRALIWQALEHLVAGATERAMDSLDQLLLVQDPHFWLPDRNRDELMLTTLTRGLVGHREVMQRELELLRDRFPYADWQRHRYMARYLLGEIDEAELRAQPKKQYMAGFIALTIAVRHDLAGDRALARAAYAALLTTRHHPEIQLFIQWRRAAQGD